MKSYLVPPCRWQVGVVVRFLLGVGSRRLPGIVSLALALAGVLLPARICGQGFGSSTNEYAGTYDPPYTVVTIAGMLPSANSSWPLGGSADGAGSAASFNYPGAVAVDGSGYIYIADTNNSEIRKITPVVSSGATTYYVNTLAGNGDIGYNDGTGSVASFYAPQGIAVDSSGNVYVADTDNNTIRRITPAGAVSTIAGTPSPSFSITAQRAVTAAVATSTLVDGTNANAEFSFPMGLAVDGAGNIYVADCGNNAIRKITPTIMDGGTAYVVTTIAGGTGGSADGVGTAAQFKWPIAVALDGAGNLYVADSGNDEIRLITPTASGGVTSWVVTTLAGVPEAIPVLPVDGPNSKAIFNGVGGVAVDGAGNVYVTDDVSLTVRRITPTVANGLTSWTVTTLAGGSAYTTTPYNFGYTTKISPFPGYADGTGSGALFLSPSGIAVDGAGNFYVADTRNNAIRMGSPAKSVYIVSQPQAASVSPSSPGNFTVAVNLDSGSTFQWSALSPGSGTWTVLSDGGGVSGSTSQTLTVDPAAVFNGWQFACAVTKGSTTATSYPARLTASGPTTYTPYAFSRWSGIPGGEGYTDGTDSGVLFSEPMGIATDSAGNVYVADYDNDAIRKVTPDGLVSTLAGRPLANPEGGSADGTGSAAEFNGPSDVAVDTAGNVYVADSQNSTIRKITPAGVVTTLAGTATLGMGGSSDGIGSAAQFNSPYGVAVDGAGNVYVADTNNYIIRMVTPGGVVSTIAGLARQNGSADGAGSVARFASPYGIALDGAGNLYVTDSFNYTVRKITPTVVNGSTAWAVTTLAGTPGTKGYADGPGSAAQFGYLSFLTVDGAGNVYVSDLGNTVIREITPTVINGATAYTVTTLAGQAGAGGYANGRGPLAKFSVPEGVALNPAGGLYIDDSEDSVIRTLTPYQLIYGFGPVTWWVGPFVGTVYGYGYSDGIGILAQYWEPEGVAVDGAGNVYVADTENQTIRAVSPQGVVTTLAGNPLREGSADGQGSSAQFNFPGGVSVDGAGTLYVADTYNDTVRKVSPVGAVTTLAGTATQAGSSDGYGANAGFNAPAAVASDSAGNVFVADTGNDTIRAITPAGLVTTLAGLAGKVGTADGTGSAARFSGPKGVAVDGADNLYVADTGNNVIRKVTPAGVVTTLAGTAGAPGGSGDGTGSSVQFNGPEGVAVDAGGNVFVVDSGNSTVRRIAPDGRVTTLGGQAGQTGSADGIGGAALFSGPLGAPLFIGPVGVAVDGAGHLYVADAGNDTIREGIPSATPYIAVQPQAQTVNAGSEVVLSVTAFGNSALSYQWSFNGAPIAGATSATLTLADVQVENAGNYQVEVSGAAGGSVVSGAATIAVNSAGAFALPGQPASQTVAAGGTVIFSIDGGASPQELPQVGTSGAKPMVLSGTTYQWQFNGVNLVDGNGISGSQRPQLIIQGATAAENGDYACAVTTGGVSTVSNAAGLVVVSTSTPGSVMAISIRAFVGTGDNILIGGFYITGSTSCTVLVQALGPALTGLNVSGVLQHPALTIHQNQGGKDVILYSNTGWGSSQVLLGAAAAAYAQPALTPGSADSEILATLPPGGYTAEVTGADGGTGVALCAVYQLP